MRLRTFKHIDIINTYPHLLKKGEYKGSLRELFNNDHPIYLEIGCGKGDFIITMAKTYPDINFIAVERFDNVIARALFKAGILPNLYFIKDDALCLNEYIDKEIDEIFLNFSDPWPKKRHAKKRLTSDIYLKSYEALVKKDLIINQKTDNRHFFEYSLISYNQNGFIFEDISLSLHEDKENIITSEYERKFLEKNMPIYYFRGRKCLWKKY